MGIPEVSQASSGDLLLGPHAVREALRAGRRKVRRIFLARDMRDERLGEIVALAGRQGIPVRQVTRDRMASLAATDRHQGVIAQADPFTYADPEEVAARAAARSPLPLMVALDGIEDPQNLGGILRTAETLGVDAVILPRHRAAAVTASVLRAASGAAEHLTVARATNMAACLERLKALGYWICGAAVEGGVPLHQVDLARPLVLVVGGEHSGLRPGVRGRCDMLVTIPMPGRVGSLNAGVATGIVLYEALRQRSLVSAEKKSKPKEIELKKQK
jgi:23S rRNA (guanosine2251-2'-O)-methyltransferase